VNSTCDVRRTTILAGIAAISLAMPVRAQDAVSAEPFAQLIQRVLEAGSGLEISAAYRDLFAAVGVEGLAELKRSPHDSIAIQAAWEEVLMTIPATDGAEAYRPDAQVLQRFIGFLEGRGRVTLPDWWAKVFLNVRAHDRGNVFSLWPGEEHKFDPNAIAFEFNGKRELRLSDPYEGTDVPFFVLASRGTRVTDEDGRVTISAADRKVEVPEELVDRGDHGTLFCCFSTVFTAEQCYVAVHRDVGYPFTVACLNLADGTLKWKTEAWGTWWGFATGIHQTRVAVTVQDDRLAVFGEAGTGYHVEAFDIGTGANLFRFSTGYR